MDNQAMSKSSLDHLQSRLIKNKKGEAIGVLSVCSSHPAVIESTLNYALDNDFPILIESTCNQVNQFGGYTGLTPDQFADYLQGLTATTGYPLSRLILGGDHLGPYPWRSMDAQSAMKNARQLVVDCVAAGYQKIHLDASMHCGDDDQSKPLDISISAQRTAQLCQAAEEISTKQEKECVYVIGSEVPAPGGEQSGHQEIQVTRLDNIAETIQITRQAFLTSGLEKAWDRVIAVVVQPGVDYFDHHVHHYDPAEASALSEYIEGIQGLVFEAHSTDYQTRQSLSQLVQDHFAILKVGPELTFKYRETIFALEQIEISIAKFNSEIEPSQISQVIDREMVSNPKYWGDYYSGSEDMLAFSRKFSLNDRIRYYWSRPKVQKSLEKLFSNLDRIDIPLSLVSQFLPEQYHKLYQGDLSKNPEDWIEDKIKSVLEKYHRAIS
jgi:D-tagatose-1,6-bisphosphate aldolase subunit GatZ/KbaZ